VAATKLYKLLVEIRQCTHCAQYLEPNPVLQAGTGARLLIAGQAPGAKVHASGIAWQDASGDRLREWLGIDADTFYDHTQVALLPMGFCYPGKGNSGDLPPRPECAQLWRAKLHAQLKNIRLTILVGTYAIQYYLGDTAQPTITDTVRNGKQYLPTYIPLVHPSPRNRPWLSQNPWFETTIVPRLRKQVAQALDGA
jgi:uracil-DNA glycosylase